MEDLHHAGNLFGLARVDPNDVRVGMRREQHRHGERVGGGEIPGETLGSDSERQGINLCHIPSHHSEGALRRRAHAPHLPPPQAPLQLSPALRRSDARRTASAIFT